MGGAAIEDEDMTALPHEIAATNPSGADVRSR